MRVAIKSSDWIMTANQETYVRIYLFFCVLPILHSNHFQFNRFSGNGRVVYDFRNSGITPLPLILGLNVDRNGYLWCTLYESGLLVIIDPM